jgi:hypothetical protein
MPGCSQKSIFRPGERFPQGTKIRRARPTRHFWCVRRTLRREITFLSPAGYKFAETLMAQGGRRRVTPALLHCQEDQPVCRVTTVHAKLPSNK